MKKKIWLRGLLGFPLGIAVGHVISLIISLGWGCCVIIIFRMNHHSHFLSQTFLEVVPFLVPVISVTIWELKSFAAFIGPPFSAYAVL